MTLMNPLQKRNHTRSRPLLDGALGMPCQYRSPWCKNDTATVVAAHSDLGEDGKGMKIKADDLASAYTCHICHGVYDGSIKTPLSRFERQAMFDRAVVRTLLLRREQGLIEVKGER